MTFDITAIGNNLVRLRKEKGMTQSAFAETLLVTRQAVSKWERGECMPDISLLAEIAEILGTDIGSILGAKASKALDSGSYELIAHMIETKNYSYARHLLSKVKAESAQKLYYEALIFYKKQLFEEARDALVAAKGFDSDEDLYKKIFLLARAVEAAFGGEVKLKGERSGWVRLFFVSLTAFSLLAAVCALLLLT